ncbi:MAG: hypothetical protein L0H53_09045 [Candidatus Nitrosocosmicus sp.]|nr:hypothetical protein [Candidatus Nitrosocosmicus sp.]MDN5866768.1 hypothetical protein [Candidatus Nitrosocosmicus sp.]
MSKASNSIMNKQGQGDKFCHILLSAIAVVTLLVSSTMIADLALASQGGNQGNFIIRATLIDDSNIDIDNVFYDLVDIYIKEHPNMVILI